MKQTKSSGNVFADMGLPNADVLQKISTMQCDLEKLKQSIQKPEGLWKPRCEDVVAYINSRGEVNKDRFEDLWDNCFTQGNVFQTLELAQAESERRAIFQELKELAGGYEFDKDEFNYHIKIIGEHTGICLCSTTKHMNQVYFKTEEQAQHAIDTLGENKIRKLF